MRLLAMWLALGVMSSGIMYLGFYAKFGRMAPRLWGHVILTVPFWPISLMSACLAITGHPTASRRLEASTHGWLDAVFDWWNLRRLRKFGGPDLKTVSLKGDMMDLASYEDIVMPPEVYVQCGGTLPPDRPDSSDAIIRVRKGVATWEL